MGKTCLYAILLIAFVPNSSAIAAPKKTHVPAGCSALMSQYADDIDLASRYMALGAAISNEDMRFQSATEQKQANALSRSTLDLTAIKAAGCRAPAIVANPKTYEGYANACEIKIITSRYDAGTAGECDPLLWQKAVH